MYQYIEGCLGGRGGVNNIHKVSFLPGANAISGRGGALL